jgi:hypothetical protein
MTIRCSLALLAWLLAGLLAGVACDGDDDDAPTTETDAGQQPEPEPWQLVFEELEPSLMSVSGSAADDVWAVGADARDGSGALVLHYDGERWQRMSTGVEADLWWVHVMARDSVWMAGAKGTILHYDGDTFTKLATPGSGTVYGVWGVSDDDLWAVGGVPEETPGFAWRYDGSAWTDVSAELPDGMTGQPIFKVWGRASDDAWLVGLNGPDTNPGLAVHWNGSRFEKADSGTRQRLFTVHGTESGEPAYVAVGGYGEPVILEHDGTRWHNATPKKAPAALYGVYLRDGKLGYAVGHEGGVLRRTGGAWKLLETGLELFDTLHSVWVDPDDGVWAVGGAVNDPIPVAGMLIHLGNEVADVIEE